VRAKPLAWLSFSFMPPFPLIDLHQDILSHLTHREIFAHDANLQTSFDLIQSQDIKLVCATAFPVPLSGDDFDPIVNQLIEDELIAYQQKTIIDLSWMLVKTQRDVDQVMRHGQPNGLLLHIEGLNVFPKDGFALLDRWYDIGLRSLGIVWNPRNQLGGGAKDTTEGLTALGKRVIEWCEEKQIIIDFAHMNEKTFWDATKIIHKPIYVSHGNCRALCNDPRNYTDEQLRVIANTNGVIGVMFAKTFVTGRTLPGKMDDVIFHIDHLVKIIGEDHIAFGTDLGGIVTGFVSGLECIDQLPIFFQTLRIHGYSEERLEKMCYKNAARVLKEYLPI